MKGRIYLLTGEIQSGKSSLCLEVVNEARERGLKLGGLISPAVFLDGEKAAIDLLELRSGEQRRLADGPGGSLTEITTRRWAFYPEAIAWGNEVLRRSIPCDLLLIDEFGPLEFLRGEGWVAGFKTVESGDFQAALLVIRPSLLEQAHSRWDVAGIINLDDPDQQFNTGKKVVTFLLGG